MILAVLILWLAAGALLSWLAGRAGKDAPRWVSLAMLIIALAGLIVIWVQTGASVTGGGAGGQKSVGQSPWLIEFNAPWIPQWGISIYLALDGLNLLLLMLTVLLGIMAVGVSWRGVEDRVPFFHFNLMWTLAALAGLFLALDLFLFYFFWELMLVPLYFLIGIWGHERRTYATLKFFIFTQASSLLMLLAIIGLYLIHGHNTGVYTFNYTQLLGQTIAPVTAFWLMLGFFVAFAVKLPLVPLHTWLPDAHTEAPTAGSVYLAGLVLKAGAYGFLRFLIPLFPQAAFAFAPVAMWLGVAGILYGAIAAYGQNDLKRLVAYTSVSHMGFVILGIFAWNQLALQGAMVIMLAHGITTGALFMLVGQLGDRLGTRDMRKMGGLWPDVPRLGGFTLFFAIATLGLPGLGNFVGEFLVLLGVYRVSTPLAVVATLGFIVSTVYALSMIQRVFYGPRAPRPAAPVTSVPAAPAPAAPALAAPAPARGLAWSAPRDIALMIVMAVLITWLGLYPQTVLDPAGRALTALQQLAQRPGASALAAAGHDLQPVTSNLQPAAGPIEQTHTPPGGGAP